MREITPWRTSARGLGGGRGPLTATEIQTNHQFNGSVCVDIKLYTLISYSKVITVS